MQAARGTPLSSPESGAEVSRGSFRPRLWLLFAGVALSLYALDQIVKHLAVNRLAERDVAVVGDWLNLTLVYNPGAAFGAGSQFTTLISCVAIVATVLVLVLSRRLGSRTWAVALGILLAGITGNLTDRLLREPAPLRGHVIDMIQLPNWPVFNVADICINVAAGLIVILAFRGIRINGTRERDDDLPDIVTDEPGDR